MIYRVVTRSVSSEYGLKGQGRLSPPVLSVDLQNQDGIPPPFLTDNRASRFRSHVSLHAPVLLSTTGYESPARLSRLIAALHTLQSLVCVAVHWLANSSAHLRCYI